MTLIRICTYLHAARAGQAPQRSSTSRWDPHWHSLGMHTESCPDHHLEDSQWKEEDSSEVKVREYEEEHVHGVYQQIASHFSSTRYKVCAPET